jgi:hypothetical protein
LRRFIRQFTLLAMLVPIALFAVSVPAPSEEVHWYAGADVVAVEKDKAKWDRLPTSPPRDSKGLKNGEWKESSKPGWKHITKTVDLGVQAKGSNVATATPSGTDVCRDYSHGGASYRKCLEIVWYSATNNFDYRILDSARSWARRWISSCSLDGVYDPKYFNLYKDVDNRIYGPTYDYYRDCHEDGNDDLLWEVRFFGADYHQGYGNHRYHPTDTVAPDIQHPIFWVP